MALLAILTIGGFTYNVYETGNELTCRANKPIGWEIVNEYEVYSEAVCNYATKEPVYANCSSFRSTGSYERYGCQEVIVQRVESGTTEPKDGVVHYKCTPGEDNCVVI